MYEKKELLELELVGAPAFATLGVLFPSWYPQKKNPGEGESRYI